jgi:hypothetical protein
MTVGASRSILQVASRVYGEKDEPIGSNIEYPKITGANIES